MYPIYYLNAHGSVILKETSATAILTDAVAGAHRQAIDVYHASGFVVFDATGDHIMHREWWGQHGDREASGAIERFSLKDAPHCLD